MPVATNSYARGTIFPTMPYGYPHGTPDVHLASSSAQSTSASAAASNEDSTTSQKTRFSPYPPKSVFEAVQCPDALLDRVNTAWNKVDRPDFPWHGFLMRKDTFSSTIVTMDHNGRLLIPNMNRNKHLIYTFGYPEFDYDVNFLLQKMAYMSWRTLMTLYTTLCEQLHSITKMAKETVTELESALVHQLPFRFISVAEVKNIMRKVVQKFCEARELVILKYCSYNRTVRWTENLSSRWRAGCLSSAQNNVLREWLFDHFDGPYTSPEERDHLAKVTGLRGDQVSIWLINARSRIWKPACKILCPDGVRAEMLKNDAFSDLKTSLSEPQEGWYENLFSVVDSAPPGSMADLQRTNQSDFCQGVEDTSRGDESG